MSDCRSCHRRIRWAKSASTGRSMPFDPEPVPHGPGVFALLGSVAYAPDAAVALVSERQGVSEQRARQILDDNDDWYISHFATCPHAATHRRGQQAAPVADPPTLL